MYGNSRSLRDLTSSVVCSNTAAEGLFAGLGSCEELASTVGCTAMPVRLYGMDTTLELMRVLVDMLRNRSDRGDGQDLDKILQMCEQSGLKLGEECKVWTAFLSIKTSEVAYPLFQWSPDDK